MKQINQIIFDTFRALTIDEIISSNKTDITCTEGERTIIRRVIEHEMNGTGHVDVAPVISDQPKCLTYYVAGHMVVTVEQVTVEKPFKHVVYQVTIDTSYLNVVATADKYGKCKVDLKVLDGKGNIEQRKLFRGKTICSNFFQSVKNKFWF